LRRVHRQQTRLMARDPLRTDRISRFPSPRERQTYFLCDGAGHVGETRTHSLDPTATRRTDIASMSWPTSSGSDPLIRILSARTRVSPRGSRVEGQSMPSADICVLVVRSDRHPSKRAVAGRFPLVLATFPNASRSMSRIGHPNHQRVRRRRDE